MCLLAETGRRKQCFTPRPRRPVSLQSPTPRREGRLVAGTGVRSDDRLGDGAAALKPTATNHGLYVARLSQYVKIM